MSVDAAATVVLPTRHEQDNIGPLLEELSSVANSCGLPVELLVVDDSDDPATIAAVQAAQERIQLPGIEVNWHHRPVGERPGRLSGAMETGLRLAKAPIVVFKDGDGQHPPALLPKLVNGVQAGHDIVVGSRYREGGSSEGLDGRLRHFVSRAATILTKFLFPRGLRGISDPMSGCFAVRKEAVDTDRLDPRGFKFLLDALVRHPEWQRNEVPLQFRERQAGESKASEGNGREFLKQLPVLRVRTLPTWLNFALVGGVTAVFGMALMWILVHLGVNPLMAKATELAVTLALNFGVNWRFTWPGQDPAQLKWQVPAYAVARSVTLVLAWYLFAVLYSGGFHYQAANVAAILAGAILNYPATKAIFDAEARRKMQGLTRSAFKWAPLLVIAASLVAVAYWFDLTPLTTGMLAIALFNTGIGALEARWRTYGWRDPQAADDMGWPEPAASNDSTNFWIIVPGRHEAAHIGATLQGLLATTHDFYQIVVTLCDDDPTTIDAARKVLRDSRRGHRIHIVTKHYDKPSKPQQLNTALDYIRGEMGDVLSAQMGQCFVGVIDAEDVVHTGLLSRVAALARKTNPDIIQGGVQLMNPGDKLSQWFQVHNVMEYYAWFASRMAYQAQAGFVPLGGNTVFIRYELLVEAGGWPLSLTEDCALGVQLCTQYNAKVVTAYAPQYVTQEEAPPTIFNKQLGSLFFQRVRWNQGFFQELLRGDWLKMPTLRQRLLAGYILATPFLQALSALLIPVALVTAVTLKLPVPVTMLMFAPFVPIAVSIATQMVGLHDFARAFSAQRRVRFWHYVSLVAMAWPYQLILGAAAVYAAIRHLRGDTSWYKTGRAGAHHELVMEGTKA